MDINDLPPELITCIFCRLPGKDLATVAQTCKKFHEASLVEAIWLLKCKEEFGVSAELQGPDVESYRQLYTKVLYPYGHLLGVWQPQMGPYGGLVKIQITGGIIKAIQYITPVDPKVYLPLRTKDLFQVRFDPQEGLAHVECLKGKNGPHKLQIMANSSKPEPEFTVKCCKPEKHNSSVSQRGSIQEFRDWIMEEINAEPGEFVIQNFDFHLDLLKMKYIKLREYDSICTFKGLEPPKAIDNMPIQPGIFKGTYGGHGIELIYVTYDGNRIKGIKISGDPNVPATKVSLEVHLDEPMVLDLAQQESIFALEELDLEVVRTSSDETQTSQPFHLPFEVHDRGMTLLGQETGLNLGRCKQRFYGTGLIAMSGFRDAERTPAHCIIFNDDVMAFLWLKLRSVSIYSRVKEDVWS
ncbi:F-box only protein 31-like [Lytechinus variegatus]|uniref:F-box only protein 31-like n=1 Tax=Lytechinus variegatus TaxID=7654 RepID=UPI001BB12330|nr:F-box only protein 31-like [Lytechinus variegatus]